MLISFSSVSLQLVPGPGLWYDFGGRGVKLMFVIDVPNSTLNELLSEVAAAGGDALRFTVYESTDEIPDGFTTQGLLRPDETLHAGEASFFPKDRL